MRVLVLGFGKKAKFKAPQDGVRPKTLAGFMGQQDLKYQLEIALAAAKIRGEALPHIILFGPPGLGKTTLAGILATEMEAGIFHTSGPVLRRVRDMSSIVRRIAPKDILFVDEIHRLPAVTEESMYSVMEDFRLDLRSRSIPLPQFTIVGATTLAGGLTAPLRTRFPIKVRLEYYSTSELVLVVKRAAGKLSFAVDDEAAEKIARRARGTPRTAINLLGRVRDYSIVKRHPATSKLVSEAMQIEKIDINGLRTMDIQYMTVLATTFGGGPAGAEAIASTMGEARITLVEDVEPFLLRQGLLMRTRRGRTLTDTGHKYVAIHEES